MPLFPLWTKVARWHIFKPKIIIWVIFLAACNGRGRFILWPFRLYWRIFVIIYGHFGIFVGYFGIFSSILVSITKKNLATLLWTRSAQ
jgi:hypothetical protein